MRVRCISRRGESLPREYLDPRVNVTREADFRLTIGKEYVVYAVAIQRDQVWYYIVDDADLWFPIYKPAPLFTIIDDQASRFWRVKITPGNPDHNVLLAFHEWVSDGSFYERLSDKSPLESAIFQSRRKQMDDEFELNDGEIKKG